MMATVRVMSPADTPTADAKAMTLRRPASGRTIKIIGMTRNRKKGELIRVNMRRIKIEVEQTKKKTRTTDKNRKRESEEWGKCCASSLRRLDLETCVSSSDFQT